MKQVLQDLLYKSFHTKRLATHKKRQKKNHKLKNRNYQSKISDF